mmetsp:Transcript_17248/g.36244  ORF Transcript_17248/g.36244 Transcript_17248/m.36244 type:complete len:127 (-) Transcript_17248:1120-1500(-)
MANTDQGADLDLDLEGGSVASNRCNHSHHHLEELILPLRKNQLAQQRRNQSRGKADEQSHQQVNDAHSPLLPLVKSPKSLSKKSLLRTARPLTDLLVAVIAVDVAIAEAVDVPRLVQELEIIQLSR